VYVDDCIIIGEDMNDIDQFELSMQNGPENFVSTDEGSINKFFGIKIKRLGPKEFEISQPFLIDCIVSFLGIKPQEYEVHCNDKFTPAAAQVLNNLAGNVGNMSATHPRCVKKLQNLGQHACWSDTKSTLT
jgi:hypothetical protein